MKQHDVLQIVYNALRQARNNVINDVQLDGCEGHGEIVLTTDDGDTKQDWVIREDSITEAERGYDDGSS